MAQVPDNFATKMSTLQEVQPALNRLLNLGRPTIDESCTNGNRPEVTISSMTKRKCSKNLGGKKFSFSCHRGLFLSFTRKRHIWYSMGLGETEYIVGNIDPTYSICVKGFRIYMKNRASGNLTC